MKSRIAVVNQRRPERTEWKESAICTKTWNNSVLQVMRARALVDAVCSALCLSRAAVYSVGGLSLGWHAALV